MFLTPLWHHSKRLQKFPWSRIFECHKMTPFWHVYDIIPKAFKNLQELKSWDVIKMTRLWHVSDITPKLLKNIQDIESYDVIKWHVYDTFMTWSGVRKVERIANCANGCKKKKKRRPWASLGQDVNGGAAFKVTGVATPTAPLIDNRRLAILKISTQYDQINLINSLINWKLKGNANYSVPFPVNWIPEGFFRDSLQWRGWWGVVDCPLAVKLC